MHVKFSLDIQGILYTCGYFRVIDVGMITIPITIVVFVSHGKFEQTVGYSFRCLYRLS